MSHNWSPQQDKALLKANRWIQDPSGQPLFRLFGCAGTGKTTLAKELASSVSGPVLFAAYTGKAASVLRKSGAEDARTLHSLIYSPKDRSRQRLNELKEELEQVEYMIYESRMENAGVEDYQTAKHLLERLANVKAKLAAEEKNAQRPDFQLNLESDLNGAALLVVDECSMVNTEMAMDILSFNVPVLVLGDPAQLPPVGGEGYFVNAKPDVMLTEIHRQARDNPIIDLATRVREGERLPLGNYGESSVIEKATAQIALSHDQILVGRNRTRLSTNKRVRQLKGYADQSPYPLEGEKLVCLRNDKEFNLLNGTLHTAAEDAVEAGGFLNLRIRPEDNPDASPALVSAHREHFTGDGSDIGHWTRRDAQEFTYGYALTVHKAQGSQWPRVMVINESGTFKDADTRRKWLYTAITRAQEAVTVVSG